MIEDQLRWWLTVTEIVEREPEHVQLILRWRLRGATLDDCRKRLVEHGHSGFTKNRIRSIFETTTRRIQDSMTPPATGVVTTPATGKTA